MVWPMLYCLNHGLRSHIQIFPTFHQVQVWPKVRRKQELAQCAELGTVDGHAGKLLFGKFEPEALPVVLMVGRIQFVIPLFLILALKR